MAETRQVDRQHDAQNAATYLANAEAYKTQIRDTIGPLRDQIAQVPADKRWLVWS